MQDRLTTLAMALLLLGIAVPVPAQDNTEPEPRAGRTMKPVITGRQYAVSSMKHQAMPWRRRLVVAFFLVAWLAPGEALAGTLDDIVGTWRGSSVCVDRRAAPACNDEQVIYDISVTPGKPNAVTVKADRVVDGKRVSMGDLDFTYETKSSSWTTELDNPRVHALWRLTVSGTTMTGTLTLLPSKAVVRRIDLKKDN